jgi:hypothetical protein
MGWLEWLFSWEVTSVIAGSAVATALATIALKGYRAAKICFPLAVADAIGGIIMWGISATDSSTPIGNAVNPQ